MEEEKKVNTDDDLDNYVNNFMNLKEKYFWHLKKFDTKNVDFGSEQLKKKVLIFNIISENREEALSELYKQKYLITEDQLIDFIRLLFIWKCNINP